MRIGGLYTYQDEEGYKGVWTSHGGYNLRLECFIDNGDPFLILEKRNSPFVNTGPSLKVLTKEGVIGWLRCIDFSRLQEKTP
jgi:hypothetical protein